MRVWQSTVTTVWLPSNLPVSFTLCLPVFQWSYYCFSCHFSPTNPILHFMALKEHHRVVVGSGSERLTGFRINSLTPGRVDSSHVGVFTGREDFYSLIQTCNLEVTSDGNSFASPILEMWKIVFPECQSLSVWLCSQRAGGGVGLDVFWGSFWGETFYPYGSSVICV